LVLLISSPASFRTEEDSAPHLRQIFTRAGLTGCRKSESCERRSDCRANRTIRDESKPIPWRISFVWRFFSTAKSIPKYFSALVICVGFIQPLNVSITAFLTSRKERLRPAANAFGPQFAAQFLKARSASCKVNRSFGLVCLWITGLPISYESRMKV